MVHEGVVLGHLVSSRCNDPPRRYNIITLITQEIKFFIFFFYENSIILLMKIIVNLNFTNIYICMCVCVCVCVPKHAPMFNQTHEC